MSNINKEWDKLIEDKDDWDDLFNLISNDCDRANIDVNIGTLIWTIGFLEYQKGEVILEQLKKRYSKLFEYYD